MLALLLSTAALSLSGGAPAAIEADGVAVPESIPFQDLEEQRAVSAVNAARSARGLEALVFSPILSEAAAWKARDLRLGALAHEDRQGRSIRERFTDFGYPANTFISENLARGFATGAGVVAAWMDSPGHRANILGGDVIAYGISRAQRSTGANDWDWVLTFGSHADGPQPGAGAPPASDRLTVPLVPGWNLVSWQGDWISGPTLRETLPDSVLSVTTWDLPSGSWLGVLPFHNINQLAYIGPGQPLWVWSEGPGNWRQPLAATSGREVALATGWQLVSWQGADDVALSVALASILPRVRSAARFDPQTQTYELFIPGMPVASFLAVSQGDAFWLLVDGEALWLSGGVG
ncbi:MAG: putative conserved protein YkwD, contains CAP (CSP/antigen 5/PR1) domain, partial [Chloroflexi bacterium]